MNPGDLDVLLRSLLGLLVGFRVVTLIHPVDGVGVVVLEEPVRSLRLDRRHHTLEPDHGNLRRGPYVGPLVRPDLERDHVARSRVALSVLKAAAVVPESDFTLSRRLDRVPILLLTLLLLGYHLFGSFVLTVLTVLLVRCFGLVRGEVCVVVTNLKLQRAGGLRGSALLVRP